MPTGKSKAQREQCFLPSPRLSHSFCPPLWFIWVLCWPKSFTIFYLLRQVHWVRSEVTPHPVPHHCSKVNFLGAVPPSRFYHLHSFPKLLS